METTEVAPVRVFTLADARHFTGVVALVNSVRVQGERAPITVLDLGLDGWQREALRAECDFASSSDRSHHHPWLLEPHACMTRPAEVVVYVDADVILTGSLDGVIRSARGGKLIVFGDIMETRRFGEWEEIFGLRAPLRVQPYANAGFLAFSTAHFPDLLARWAECCDRLVGQSTYLDTSSFESATALSSQDALNAILMSEIALEQLDLEPAEVAAEGPNELAHTRVVDVEHLRCTRNGHPTALLHAWGTPKPWQPAARVMLRRSAYLTCLRRLLLAPDVAVRVPDDSLPAWLRPGVRGRLSLWYLTQARRPWRGVRERGKWAVEVVRGKLHR